VSAFFGFYHSEMYASNTFFLKRRGENTNDYLSEKMLRFVRINNIT